MDCLEVRQLESVAHWSLGWHVQFPRVSQAGRQDRFQQRVRLEKLPANDLEPVGLGHNENQAAAGKNYQL